MARLRRGSGEPSPTQGPPRRLRSVGSDTYPDWDAVYRDNVDRIYGAIFAKVGNRADAEDLTAEVFLAALGPLRVSASVGEVRAYLFAAARTALAGHWRRHYGRQVTSLPEEMETMELAAASAATVSAAERTAEEMLADLPQQYQLATSPAPRPPTMRTRCGSSRCPTATSASADRPTPT